MDKTRQSSLDSTASTTTTSISGGVSGGASGSRDQYLHHLNKISHKIAKPSSSSSSLRQARQSPPPPPPQPSTAPATHNPNPNQNQPPVYNISKSDFRDVVQKLTGSPAHERAAAAATPPQHPPIHPTPKHPTSRLHRIRPPPLSQIANRPPPLIVGMNPAFVGGNAFGGFRPSAPLSPLPPLPTCHAAAESPISAYMRFLHTSMPTVDPDPRRIPGIPPFTGMNPNQMQNQPSAPPPAMPTPQFVLPPPSSPLSFGCFASPKSPCPLLSTNSLFSPTGTGQLGFSQLPISPNVPAVPSPR